jgi:hypothetical protein
MSSTLLPLPHLLILRWPGREEPELVRGDGTARWVMAFDASCSRCRRMSEVVHEVCDGKLEVLPLADRDVAGWREQALGERPPWAPTLIRVADDGVRAWTGVAMGARLVAHLGPRSTLRLLDAFGGLSTEDGKGGRRGFLRLTAGVGTVAGIVLVAGAPALASAGIGTDGSGDEAEDWAAANSGALPSTYGALIQEPLARRQAAYVRLDRATKRQLWLDHLDAFARARPALTGRQRAVLSQAAALVRSDEFAHRKPELDPRIGELKTAAFDAFSREEAIAAVATLGPVTPATAESNCNCSLSSDLCIPQICYGRSCNIVDGCGVLWWYTCDGQCL